MKYISLCLSIIILVTIHLGESKSIRKRDLAKVKREAKPFSGFDFPILGKHEHDHSDHFIGQGHEQHGNGYGYGHDHHDHGDTGFVTPQPINLPGFGLPPLSGGFPTPPTNWFPFENVDLSEEPTVPASALSSASSSKIYSPLTYSPYTYDWETSESSSADLSSSSDSELSESSSADSSYTSDSETSDSSSTST